MNLASRKSTPSGNSIKNVYKTCFYANALYMGCFKSPSRSGVGLTLYYPNTKAPSVFYAAITSHNKQTQFHGHCIFYGKRILVSAEYNRNSLISIAYRVDGFLLYLSYNSESKIEGECYLIDYLKHQVIKIVFEKGRIVSKRSSFFPFEMKEQEFLQSIFTQGRLDTLIGIKHAKAISHDLTQSYSSLKKTAIYEIPNIKTNKIGNKIEIFYHPNNNWAANSKPYLGFSFFYRMPGKGGFNIQKNIYEDDFDLQLIEKGEYLNQQLNGYGQKLFKNNNLYIGKFYGGTFDGEGILRNPLKNSWVYGIFENGEMAELIDSCDEGEEQKREFYSHEIIRSYKETLHPTPIDEIDFRFCDEIIESIFQYGNYYDEPPTKFQDRKKSILKRITAHYLQNENSEPALTKRSKGESTTKHRVNYMVSEQIVDDFERTKRRESLYEMLGNPSFVQYQERQGDVINTKTETENMKRVSRIFNKTYEHLKKEEEDRNEGFLRLHKISRSNKKRKMKIFNETTLKQGLSFNEAYSMESPNKVRLSPNIMTSTILKRRSPQRITGIFQGSRSKSPKQFSRKRVSPEYKVRGKQESSMLSPVSPQKIDQTYRKTSRSGPNRYPSKSPRKTTIFNEEEPSFKKDLFSYQMIDGESNENREQERYLGNGSKILKNLTSKYASKPFGSISPTYQIHKTAR